MNTEAKVFKSITNAVAYVRGAIRTNLAGSYSIGLSPVNVIEREYQQAIFVRWNNGASHNEAKSYLESLSVTLHAGRGPIRFVLTRSEGGK